jgi:ankyrin repeat protein
MRAVHALLNHGYTASQPAQQPQQARDGGGASPSPQAAGRAQQRIVLLQDATLPDGHRGAASFVDLRTRTGLSALHYAAFWGSTGCVRALLTAGASVSQQLVTSPRRQCELPVHSGSTALHLAAESGHAAMAALLLHAHVERMQRSSPRPLAPPAAGGGVAAERLPWEGNQHSDPRLVRNAIGDTPHE